MSISSRKLNWLLEGRAKLAKDRLQLIQTQQQKERAATLLLASDSPAAFVRCCIQKQKGGVIWMGELYEDYQKWCMRPPCRERDVARHLADVWSIQPDLSCRRF